MSAGEKAAELPVLWTIMPFVDLWDEYTQAAAEDVLAQEGVVTRLLLISNGSREDEWQKCQRWCVRQGVRDGFVRAFAWRHHPPLPTLDETWNRALDFVFEDAREAHAWVVNNDARFSPRTAWGLLTSLKASRGLFVSAIGVREDPEWEARAAARSNNLMEVMLHRGGPDFSCFVISSECHAKYRFDANLTYRGDVDYHRRLMLGGDGARIFSIDVPYLHYASKTINRSAEALAEHVRVDVGHERYYREKWGGGVNEEKFSQPFNDGVLKSVEGGYCTTPALHALVKKGEL